jgi:hypothetical protein
MTTQWEEDLEIIMKHEGRRENKCFKHPKYKCKARPSIFNGSAWGCVACWDVYLNRLYVERMGL